MKRSGTTSPSGGTTSPTLSPAAQERVARADQIIERVRAAREEALRSTGEGVGGTDGALIDRLWFAAEHGRQRKLEALALMRALDQSSTAAEVVRRLERDGYAQLAARLVEGNATERTRAVERLVEAWHDRQPGCRPEHRVGKWTAIRRLTGFSAESLRTLWKQSRGK